MNQETIPIDERPISGITPKHVVWLIGTLSSILLAVLWTYFSITNKLDRSYDSIEALTKRQQLLEAEADSKTKELQIEIANIKKDQQTLQIQILTLQVQLKEKGVIPVN